MGPVKLEVTSCARTKTFCLSLDNLFENLCSLQYTSCVQRAHHMARKASPFCSDRRLPLCPTFVLPLRTHLLALYVLHDASAHFQNWAWGVSASKPSSSLTTAPLSHLRHHTIVEVNVTSTRFVDNKLQELQNQGFETKTTSILKPNRASSRFLKMFLSPLHP